MNITNTQKIMIDIVVTFKTAKLAKSKGFFIRTLHYYNSDNPFSSCVELKTDRFNELIGQEHTDRDDETGLLRYQINPYNYAPSQSLLQRWLREKHGIIVTVFPTGGDVYDMPFYATDSIPQDEVFYDAVVQQIGVDEIIQTDALYFKTYENALEAGLEIALNQIKVK